MKNLDKLVNLQKEFSEIYNSKDIILNGISVDQVHLGKDSFLELFEEYELHVLDDETFKLTARYKDVNFICLVDINEL